MQIVTDFDDYEILDATNGEKLERWDKIYLLRPDPQIIWNNDKNLKEYPHLHAHYHRSDKGGGYWQEINKLKSSWQVKYHELVFNIKLMGFKHTGLFPEQAINWCYMMEKITKAKRAIKVLNLFAYTGAATVACLKAGASVVHVDSSKGMVDWAKENVKDNGLTNADVRYIVDDVIKFVEREIRRGNKYEAIVMDPPSFGRGAGKEIWNIEHDLDYLLKLCLNLLSEKPLFLIINSYTTGLSQTVLENMLKLTVGKKYKGTITSSEIGLPISNSDLILPCGIYGRFESDD